MDFIVLIYSFYIFVANWLVFIFLNCISCCLFLLLGELGVEGEEAGHDLALGHRGGEAVGGHDGAVVVAVGL